MTMIKDNNLYLVSLIKSSSIIYKKVKRISYNSHLNFKVTTTSNILTFAL